VLSRVVCVYHLGYITQGDAGGALVSWWWHHSRRRRDCSRVLTVCIEATPLKGAQGLLWRVGMSLRARCFFFPTHVLGSCRANAIFGVLYPSKSGQINKHTLKHTSGALCPSKSGLARKHIVSVRTISTGISKTVRVTEWSKTVYDSVATRSYEWTVICF